MATPFISIKQHRSSSALLRSLYLPAIALVIFCTGCATTSKQSGQDDANNGIKVVENRSVDLSIRRKFDNALELLRDQQYEQAIVLLNEVANGTQNNSAPYINLGIAYTKTGQNELAEASFQKALAINPNHPAALNEMGIFYRSIGRFEDARLLYERVVNKYPEFMPARRNYGILCDLYLNDVNCALEQYEAYSEANPEDETVKIWIATLRQKQVR
ncbi:tetratricopeptide repeat protein [Halioxenophilus sp. WMMB6]|uniref:tetratricopeptide repeat protein n=1 Tax=Halioxenophilus sp. WMMB6 TaxID=3073815 RepID=UPI00295F128E|nr:tetratricopeptide repeat protein [Halioxenophilus sp. WMMB6]